MMRLPAIVLAVLLGSAAAAPWLAPYAPDRIDLSSRRAAPSAAHLFGTDELGRDVLARVLFGARISLAVGLLSALIAGASGVVVGGVAGYAGGAIDAVLMRTTDAILAVPRLPLLMIVSVVLRPSVPLLIVLIGLAGWMETARVVRAEFLTLREREFVIWSESIGARALRIVVRHILPNAIAPVLVAMTLGIPAAILTESGLSFLGLGVQPPYATWGNILNDGKDSIEIAWWMTLYPGLAILITVLSYILLGEGIRDALDPRLRQARAGAVGRGR